MNNFKRYRLILQWIVSLFLSFNSCNAYTQKDYSEMISTSKNLMNYFLAGDTLGIYRLFEDENRVKNKKKEIRDDCVLFRKITSKYGLPNQEGIALRRGKHGENIIYVLLMEKRDTTLNIRKCELLVFFYPAKFLVKPSKILNYLLVESPLDTEEKGLKKLPKIEE